MKSRLSFVTRRPSTKQKEGDDVESVKKSPTITTKKDPASEKETPKQPEPMVKTGRTTTVEGLGTSSGGRPSGLGSVSSKSGSQGKSRNRSFVEGMMLSKPSSPRSLATAQSTHHHLSKGPTVIRSGFLKKRGVINVAWKKRFFILTEDILGYFDSEPKDLSAPPKGLINLAMITKVEHHNETSDADCMFDICTPSRIYRLQATSVSDMEAWIATISGTAANYQQVKRRRNTAHAGALREVAEDASFRPDAILAGPHQPADLRRWEKMTPYDVSAWLETKGMSKYKQVFYKAGINGSQLRGLSTETLSKIGITELSEQLKILSHVQKLIAEDGGFAGLQLED